MKYRITKPGVQGPNPEYDANEAARMSRLGQQYQISAFVTHKVGTVIEHPDAWMQVPRFGVPADQECADRCGVPMPEVPAVVTPPETVPAK